MRLGRASAALPILERAVRLSDGPGARRRLGEALLAQGDLEGCAAQLAAAGEGGVAGAEGAAVAALEAGLQATRPRL
jgi:hypothetical protein